jgi:hypothetical protein
MKGKHTKLKKFLATMALVWMLSVTGLVLIASAQEAPPPANPGGTEPASAPASSGSTSKDAGVKAEELFYRFTYKGADSTAAENATDKEKQAAADKQAANDAGTTSGTKIGAVNALPNISWQATLTAIIKILLNITSGITLLALTVGGTMMVISQSNPDLLEKGKKITFYSVAGLIVIAVSYAVVIGVSELEIFEGGYGGGAAESSAPTKTEKPASPDAETGITGENETKPIPQK